MLPTSTILGRLRMLEVYDYYDGPRVFSVENAAGALFLAFWADTSENGDTWIYVPISEEKLDRAVNGLLPLRDVISEPEDDHLYVLSGEIAQLIKPLQLDAEWLPPADDRLALTADHAADALEPATHKIRIVRARPRSNLGLDAVAAVLAGWREVFAGVLASLNASRELVPVGAGISSFSVVLRVSDEAANSKAIARLMEAVSLFTLPSSWDRLKDLGVDASALAALYATLAAHKVDLEVYLGSRLELKLVSRLSGS